MSDAKQLKNLSYQERNIFKGFLLAKRNGLYFCHISSVRETAEKFAKNLIRLLCMMSKKTTGHIIYISSWNKSVWRGNSPDDSVLQDYKCYLLQS